MVHEALRREWTPTDENIARLVDREDFWLGAEYSGWITDPTDPEVKRQREERKRSGHKPSPVPIIPPVAVRTESARQAAEARNDALLEALERQKLEKKKPRMTIAELREMRGK